MSTTLEAPRPPTSEIPSRRRRTRWRRGITPILWPLAALGILALVLSRAHRPAPDVETVGTKNIPWVLPAGAEPETVSVGLFLNRLSEIDVKSNSYLADFYLWFRWRGDIDPTEHFEFTNAMEAWNFSVVPVFANATDPDTPVPEIFADGTRYQVFHVQGKFGRAFPLHDYPFDEQTVEFQIEDSRHPASELMYVADAADTGYRRDILIPGWILKGVRASVRAVAYPTRFGDTRSDGPAEAYSRFSFVVDAGRPVLAYVIKTILPITIVMLITFVVFLITPGYFESRLGIAITALLSAIALQLNASSNLPSVGYIVLLDKIYNLSYLIIFLTLLVSVASVRRADAGAVESARRLDLAALVTLSILFAGGIAGIVLLR